MVEVRGVEPLTRWGMLRDYSAAGYFARYYLKFLGTKKARYSDVVRA